MNNLHQPGWEMIVPSTGAAAPQACPRGEGGFFLAQCLGQGKRRMRNGVHCQPGKSLIQMQNHRTSARIPHQSASRPASFPPGEAIAPAALKVQNRDGDPPLSLTDSQRIPRSPILPPGPCPAGSRAFRRPGPEVPGSWPCQAAAGPPGGSPGSSCSRCRHCR